MSLVRVGMSDNKKVSEGWEAVFGAKRKGTAKVAIAKKTAATKVVNSNRGATGRPSRTKQKGK
jgi:hypothetical protein